MLFTATPCAVVGAVHERVTPDRSGVAVRFDTESMVGCSALGPPGIENTPVPAAVTAATWKLVYALDVVEEISVFE